MRPNIYLSQLYPKYDIDNLGNSHQTCVVGGPKNNFWDLSTFVLEWCRYMQMKCSHKKNFNPWYVWIHSDICRTNLNSQFYGFKLLDVRLHSLKMKSWIVFYAILHKYVIHIQFLIARNTIAVQENTLPTFWHTCPVLVLN